MARLELRLKEADDALATLDELVSAPPRSLAERDGAILRFIYTFEAVWKAAALLLHSAEAVEVGSPMACIRACGRLGWLAEAEAEIALQMALDRNLAVHMYKSQIAEEVFGRLPAYVAVLKAWLQALRRQHAAPA